MTEGLGRIAGDEELQFKGQAKQVAGAAENLYGQAKDATTNFTDIVKELSSSSHIPPSQLRPLSVQLLGRTHRPI